MPTTDVAQALAAMTALWATLEEQERRHGLPPSGAPDPGIVWMVHRWASGQRLEVVLRGSDLAAGDFVRRCKQVVDLLDQIGDIAPHPALRTKARKAVDAVRRGVVAADRIDWLARPAEPHRKRVSRAVFHGGKPGGRGAGLCRQRAVD
jgi:ATP-dependent RNA helicase HelY